MRSSKKRSRSSQNRPRTLGNIVNRVFDSSGPEGKVRGTPQQIIEKYQMLARDAQLSNDRVAAENFLQHAEHYTRMLAEAMREMAAEQEARQQQYQQNGGQGGQYGGQGGGQSAGANGNQPRGERDNRDRGDRPDRGERQDRGDRRPDFQRDAGAAPQPSLGEVIDLDSGDDSGLIETPESAAVGRGMSFTLEPAADEAGVRAPGLRGTMAREGRGEATGGDGPASSEGGSEPAARRPRSPRKPRAEGKAEGIPPKEAAE